MRKRTIVMTALVTLLLASCVVKSLKPFYTKDTLAYDGSLVGKWKDSKNRIWEVHPMLQALDSLFSKEGNKAKKVKKKIKEIDQKYDSIKRDAKVTVKKNKDFFEDKELNNIYEKSYLFIEKKQLSKEEAFFTNKTMEDKGAYVVVPFQIKGHFFLDFTPLEVIESSDFSDMHHIGIHTLAKLDKKGEDFKLSWLSEDVIKELFEQKKIRIKHEKIGIEQEKILLTASSEELQKFIAKYMELAQKDEWDGVVRTFKRIK